MKEMLGGGRWPVYSGDASLSMSKRAKGWYTQTCHIRKGESQLVMHPGYLFDPDVP